MVENAGVAQLAEQRFRKARAGGSIPLAGLNKHNNNTPDRMGCGENISPRIWGNSNPPQAECAIGAAHKHV